MNQPCENFAGYLGRDGVACSQGEVILDLLRRIAAADHLDPGEPLVARKGSVWALTFLEDRLFQMDYIDAPAAAERPMESVGI
jgi:hypothetical protein